METAVGDNGRSFGTRSENMSISSSSGAVQVQFLPIRGGGDGRGHAQFDPTVSAMGHQKVKFMCSSAGRILPRPSDLKLRYVGGETRMISIPRHITYADFLAKMVEIYGADIVLRYQMPEEELDALILVSSDEDLENMLEECDRLNSVGGSAKLRVFVFPAFETDSNNLQDIADMKASKQSFVDAINDTSADGPSGITSSPFPALTNTDAFGDGYDAWNDFRAQENSAILVENFKSKIHPLDNHPPDESHLSNHISDLRSQEAFMREPTFSDKPCPTLRNTNMQTGEIADENDFYDLERDASGGSFFLAGHGLNPNYAENPWASASPRQTHKGRGLKLHNGVEDEMTSYEKSEVDTYKKENTYLDMQDQFERFEPFHEYENSGSDCFSLPPSIALQNQHQPTTAHHDDFLFMDKTQQHGFRKQSAHEKTFHQQHQQQLSPLADEQTFHHQHQQQQRFVGQNEWDRLPVYDSSGALDDTSGAVGYMETSQRRRLNATTTLTSSPRDKSRAEKTNDFLEPLDRFQVSSALTHNVLESVDGQGFVVESSSDTLEMKIGRPDLNSYILDFPPPKGIQGENGHMSTMPSYLTSKVDVRTQEEAQNQHTYEGWQVHQGASDLSVFRSDDITSQDETENQGKYREWSMQNDSESYSDNFSNDISSNIMNKQPFQGQNDSSTAFLPFLDRLQSQALPYADRDLGGVQGNGNEAFVQEMRSLSFIDNFPTLDMISDLLQSSQLVDCLPAESSSGRSIGSRSACSLEEFIGHEENISTKKPDMPAANNNSDVPLSAQRNVRDRSWNAICDALPSKEEFDTIMSTTFTSPFNNEVEEKNKLRLPESRNLIDTPESRSIKAPALSSLIDSWEVSLLQDDHHHHHAAMQYGNPKDHIIDLVPPANTEVIPEGSQLEFEEAEEFKSFDNGPRDPVFAAEREAQSRGLQIIRNCDLEELRELGSGTFGTVYHGKWRGTDVAIKRIKASCFNGRETEKNRLMDDFWREACILGKLHHPNVVAFYGVVPDGPGATLATVTEYMVNGSLKQVLQNKDRMLDRRKRLLIAMDAAFGMEYLHAKNVVHFDIKCENLLVNLRDPQRPICKVGDLGLSKVKQQTFVSGGVRGTLPWMAPELLNGGTGLVSEKVDVFSFGIVMWELLTGEEPYANMHYGAIIGGIVNNTLRPTVPRWCDPEWKALMENCWAADPSARPTFYEIAGSLRAMEASLNAKGQATTGLY